MIRQAAAVVIAVCLSQPFVHAQGTVFTVGTPAAEVHKAPSTGSPVIGTVQRGRALAVTRELGSWVSISWPDVPGGEAFVHVSTGSIARGATGREPQVARVASSAGTERSPIASDVQRVEGIVFGQSRQYQSPQSAAPLPPVYATPAHVLGVGGLMGGRSPAGFGVSARAWRKALGVQVNLSRYASSSTLSPERLTSVQFEPSVLYAVGNHVTDYLWLRPYVGSGLSIRRETLHTGIPGAATAPSVGGVGVQAFGGGEVTFASLPQFAFSIDGGYRWARRSDTTFDLDGFALALSGHWYVK